VAGKTAEYRADIDGLRAVAILAVLVFHIRPGLLSGGFVGVDVFFVISGFLIAAIIYRDVTGAGGFSLVRFYERRIRRIVPALFVLFLVTWVWALRALLPHDLMEFVKSVRYAIFSVSNFYFLDASKGYFDPEVSRMPMLHTWSLAVEEQFYVVFPLLLMAGHRWLKSRKALVWWIAGLGLVSLGFSEWMVRRDPAWAFYLLPFRAWEMLLGAFLALTPLPPVAKWRDNLAGIAGLALLAGSMVFYDEATVFPGLSALVPCAGAALVIYAGRNREAVVGRVLGCGPLVGIGLISYSVYLWHWPLIAFGRYSFGDTPAMGVVVFLMSLLLGFLSWGWVERPFRNGTFLRRKTVFAAWAVASVAFLGAAVVVKKGKGFPEHYPAEVRGYLDDRIWPQHFRSDAEETYEPDLAPVFGNTAAIPSVALWGDSHAQSLLPMLDAIAKDKGVAVRGYGMNAQMPMAGVTVVGMDHPEARSDFSAEVLADLKADAGIRTVILLARWNAYFFGNNEDSDMAPPAIVGQTFGTPAERENFIAAKLDETVTQLLAAGKKVVLVYPIPEPGLKVPDHVAKLVLAGGKAPDELVMAGYRQRVRPVREMFAKYETLAGVALVDPSGKLLRGEDRVSIRSGAGRLLYRDTNHLSVSGSMHLRELFEPVF
jgi:peptidoglycan/LPS O-acetylase OafA/YrhL